MKQYCCGGLNFGYFYDHSPLIAYDGEAPPGYGMDSFTPSTVPGCRTPHVWLDDGRSLYDAMGPEYTLLRLAPGVDTRLFEDAARQRKVQLALLDVNKREAVGFFVLLCVWLSFCFLCGVCLFGTVEGVKLSMP